MELDSELSSKPWQISKILQKNKCINHTISPFYSLNMNDRNPVFFFHKKYKKKTIWVRENAHTFFAKITSAPARKFIQT